MQTNKQDRTMNNLLTHYPVNWIDGMKLSSSHFIAVQCYFVSVSIHYEKSAYGPTIFYKTTKKGYDLL